MGILQTFNHYVTVEVISLLYCYTFPITEFGVQDLLYQKICLRTANTTDLLCNDKQWMRSHKYIEGETSLWSLYLNIAIYLPAMISSMLQGSYIDKFGFGRIIIVPLIGSFICCAVSTIVALTSLPYELLIIGKIFMGVGGHATAFTTTAYSYVIRDSDKQNQTFRIALVRSSMAIATTVGIAVIGPAMDGIGLHWTFITGMICLIIAFLDSLFRLRQPRNNPEQLDDRPWLHKCKDIFGLQTVKSYINVMKRPRERSRRLHMHLITIVFVLVVCAYKGTLEVEFLYLPLKGMNPVDISIFVSVSSLLVFFGNILGTFVFTTKLNWHLAYVTMIGLISGIMHYAGLSLANSMVALWIANTFSIFAVLSFIACRSYVSNCVEPTETATAISFLGIVQNLSKVVATLVFNGLFPLTLSTWPGMVLMIAAILCAAGIPILGYIRWHDRKLNNDFALLDECDEEESHPITKKITQEEYPMKNMAQGEYPIAK